MPTSIQLRYRALNDPKPSLLTLRWLALATAVAAVLVLALHFVATDGPWLTIVGVVGDTRHTALDSVLRPQVYVHHQMESASQMVVVLRAQGDPASYATVARAAFCTRFDPIKLTNLDPTIYPKKK